MVRAPAGPGSPISPGGGLRRSDEDGEDRDDEDGSSDEDEDEEGSEDEAAHDPAGKQLLLFANHMNTMIANRAPKVSLTPAPPSHPVRKPEHPPVALVMPTRATTIGRVMNSSAGRFLTFALTLISFAAASAGLALWQEPERVLANEAVTVLLVTLLCALAMYTVLPALAKKAGMAPTERGVDWKPYFVCYRLSYCTAIPAFVCLAFGTGAKAGFGTAQGAPGQVSIGDLDRGSMNYFEASDGFVGLNLTKGIIETLRIGNHGTNFASRSSRFRDAELRINTEAFSDEVEPTVPPGAVKIYRVAPVFGKWSICAARFHMSVACLQQNPVVGWAISTTSSLCSSLYMVACKNPHPQLDPVYRCSTNPVYGSRHKGPIAGLCGRVTSPPREGAVDELSAILLEQGWPQATLPNMSQVWLDVSPDDCIAHPASCISTWDLMGNLGLGFAAITALCIMAPCALDCMVDRRIREARRFMDDIQKTNPKVLV